MFDRKLRNQVPVPLGQELKVVGRVTSEGSRSFEGTAEIVLPNGEIAVSAEGKYLKVDIKRISDESLGDDDWFFVNNPDDPGEIEIP